MGKWKRISSRRWAGPEIMKLGRVRASYSSELLWGGPTRNPYFLHMEYGASARVLGEGRLGGATRVDHPRE